MQSAAGVMIFAEPRFATAIIDERDLAGLADANDELDRVVARLLARRPDIKLLFLVGSCPSEVIKLDLSRAAQRLSQSFAPKVRVLNYSGSGIETTFTQGEDACLAVARARPAAPRPTAPRRRCWSSARWPTSSRTSSRRLFDEMGIGPVALPAAAPRRRSAAGRARTRATCWRSPSSPTRRARSRSAARSASPRRSRSASKARRRGCRPRRDAFGVAADRFEARRRAAPRARRARARRAIARRSPASASSSFPTRSSRSRSRAFCRARCGMKLVEVGTPYLHRQHLAEELALLPAGRCLSRRPGRRQAARPLPRRRARPRRSAASASPIRSRPKASTTKWSIELVFTPIQGFDQAGDLAELFARPLRAPRTRLDGASHATHRLDLRRPAARRRDAHRDRDEGRALRAARAAGRHLRRPAVHDDRAPPRARR